MHATILTAMLLAPPAHWPRTCFVNITDLPYQPDCEAIFQKLSQLDHCVWLDSGKPGNERERFDIITALPSAVVTGTDSIDLAERLNQRLRAHHNSSPLPFSGGWIGRLEYDYRHSHFGIPNDCTGAWFGWYDWAIVVDHDRQVASLLTLASCAKRTIAKVERALASAIAPCGFTCSKFIADEEQSHYLASVARIKEYLLAGDCYQVNYTQRFSATFEGSAVEAYLYLRNAVPSPLSAYLDLGATQILSISPERFIQIRQQQALTQPIKGTIARGANSAEDEAHRQQLQQSDKDRAENVMIVDLLRNDFGQLCVPGSIHVPQLFDVQSFANVHHLVSTVEGTLPDHVSHVEFMLSCFPGGSITGAPKKRAMEIIHELESFGRQAYCGSIGYFSCNSNSDFNIAIRTMVRQGNKMHAWAGGGIVIDSQPEAEYQECFAKISRLMGALARSSTTDSPDSN